MDLHINLIFTLTLSFITSLWLPGAATASHTMFYAKILNYTSSSRDMSTFQQMVGSAYSRSNKTLSAVTLAEPERCCRKMPLINCTFFCETLFSICLAGCDNTMFNITYANNETQFGKNYGSGFLNSEWMPGSNLTVYLYEVVTDLLTGAKTFSSADEMSEQVSLEVERDFWTSSMNIIRLDSHNTSIVTMAVKVYCETNWFFKTCAVPVTSSDLLHHPEFHVSLNGGTSHLVLDCRTEESSMIEFLTQEPYKYKVDVLKSQLARFLADRVCSETAYSVNLTVENVRYEESLRSLRVVFVGHCFTRRNTTLNQTYASNIVEVSDLKMTQALLYLTPFEERIYFTDPVKRYDYSDTIRQGSFTIFLRPRLLHNPENSYYFNHGTHVTKTPCPSTGCNNTFHVSYNGHKKILGPIESPTGNLTNCFGRLIDKNNTKEQTFNSILFNINHPWNKSQVIHVDVYHMDDPARIVTGIDVTLNVNVHMGTGYTRPVSQIISSVDKTKGTSIELEVMLWCSTGKYGELCDKICTSDVMECDDESRNKANVTPICLIENGTQKSCVCPSGLAGDACNIDIHKYNINNSHINYDYFNFSPNGTKSQIGCSNGYKGFNCDERDYCSFNPCKENGQCVNGVNKYSCKCEADFEGCNCEIGRSYDVLKVCSNGSCTINKASYMCDCDSGYRGDYCEVNVDECASNPCQNSAVCQDGIGNYTCVCIAGFTGRTCDININDCNSTTCQNGGTCIDGIENYTCNCAYGFMGNNCDIDIDLCGSLPCKNGGICTDEIKGNYTCTCAVGFTDQNCTTNINDCDPNPCRNGGICFDGVANYTCLCENEFHGPDCTVSIDECDPNPCRNNGTCIDVIANITCVCENGWTGPNCTVNTDECDPNPCRNNGTCIDGIGNKTCVCVNRWTGPNCTVNTDECDPNPCRNNGTCIDGIANITCVCENGWTGPSCTVNIDECDPNPCLNEGTCVDKIASYICLCKIGFTALNCNLNINQCGVHPCQNNGTCINDSVNYTCNCAYGFTGQNCTTDINDCDLNSCQNNGTCIDGLGNFTCDCMNGFEGTNCEIKQNLCSGILCRFGQCIEKENIPVCACDVDYTGNLCDTKTNFCSSNPCVKGTCKETKDSYQCECVQGFKGLNCDINDTECTMNPCKNVGLCRLENGEEKCDCPGSWQGRFCENDVNECEEFPNACKDELLCMNFEGGYECNEMYTVELPFDDLKDYDLEEIAVTIEDMLVESMSCEDIDVSVDQKSFDRHVLNIGVLCDDKPVSADDIAKVIEEHPVDTVIKMLVPKQSAEEEKDWAKEHYIILIGIGVGLLGLSVGVVAAVLIIIKTKRDRTVGVIPDELYIHSEIPSSSRRLSKSHRKASYVF